MPYDAKQREAQVAILPRNESPDTPSTLETLDLSPDMTCSEQISGEQISGEQISGEQISGEQISTAQAADSTPQVAVSDPGRRLTTIHRVRAVGVAGVVMVLVMALLVITDAARGQSRPVSALQAKPTATATLTPSPTVYPTPTPMAGFQVYVPRDHSEGFLIQYPVTWIANSNYPGVEFDDDKVNPTHEVQVLLPGDATAVGVSGDPNDASVWVNYELNKLAEKWGTSFSQVSGPAPAVAINDVTWQSGQAILSENQTHIRVQVYATVHDGKVFIINQLASNDTFYDSVQRYFMPMLRSFTFLPPGA